MIAVGREGDDIVFFGRREGELVELRCSADEARSLIQQLSALVPIHLSGANVILPPVRLTHAPSPSPLVVAGTIEDAVQEALARDNAEIASRAGTEQRTAAAVRRSNQEELEKQAARRAARLARVGGDDE